MQFMGKELDKLIVTLPFADGTEVDCGVCASFEINSKTYFALKPLAEDGRPDPAKSYMLYRVEEDADHNPVVEYIESDLEYSIAAGYFSDHFLKDN